MNLDGYHIHPRPRGDLVLCDGRCGASLPLLYNSSAQFADEHAEACGWLVTSSMLRSFHFCERCRREHEELPDALLQRISEETP